MVLLVATISLQAAPSTYSHHKEGGELLGKLRCNAAVLLADTPCFTPRLLLLEGIQLFANLTTSRRGKTRKPRFHQARRFSLSWLQVLASVVGLGKETPSIYFAASSRDIRYTAYWTVYRLGRPFSSGSVISVHGGRGGPFGLPKCTPGDGRGGK
mmetsp:Transcript_33527/g.77300  ORF Transcript_33527/g.77300 Transcript_33527/m.77300 type:complete len:155 (+) Transcript_33527:123-587(+)